MAKYMSKHLEYGFYVNGERRKFQHGKYETNDKDEIKVLDSLQYVERVDESKAEKVDEEKKAEEKPKKATANKRKKTSAK